MRETKQPDWDLYDEFGEVYPSWQNSREAVERSLGKKRIFEAVVEERVVGYLIFSGNFGRVAQLAVAKSHRRRGIGTTLMGAMSRETASGLSTQVINCDTSNKGTIEFFAGLGYYERLRQHEMILEF